MTPTEHAEAIERALEAGPTPGGWFQNGNRVESDVNGTIVAEVPGAASNPTVMADAAYLAAANPLALRALLDALNTRTEALQGLLSLHSEPAGVTPEIIANDDAFCDFMDECDRRVKAAVEKARAALQENAK